MAYRFDMVGHFGQIGNELQKFVEIQFEFLSFITSHLYQIFRQLVVHAWPKYGYSVFLKGSLYFS